MLAKDGGNCENLLSNSEYCAERKVDGERAIAYVYDEISILNRRGNEKAYKFPEITSDLKKLDLNFVPDGEIAYFDSTGKDDVGYVASRSITDKKIYINYESSHKPCDYVMFDILEWNGVDVRDKPDHERRKLLESIDLSRTPRLKLAERVGVDGDKLSFWGRVKALDYEGLVLKKIGSPYESSKNDTDKSEYWLKLKVWKLEVVEFTGYEVQSAGITLTNPLGIRCACNGEKSLMVKATIDTKGKIKIVVKYLNTTDNNKYRQITFSKVWSERDGVGV
jgi:ATP-dependent DNA ligase